MTAADHRFEVYQDSSGGANWKSHNHVNREGKVVTTAFRGFRALSGGREVVRISSHTDRVVEYRRFADYDRRAAVLGGVSESAVDDSVKDCSVGILPRQFSDLHELQGGERTTFTFWLAVGDDPVSAEPLAWARSPFKVSVDPDVYPRAGLWTPLAVGSTGAQQEYEKLVESVIAGDSAFVNRREIIDEYGWRHFGEIYADHEAVNRPGLISHYNNQYDAIAGHGVAVHADW